MPSIQKTISTIQRIAHTTPDPSTAIKLLNLNVDLRDELNKSNDMSWHKPSIVIGFLFGAAFILLAEVAHADEINVPFTSWHSQDRDYYNSDNLGIGYTLDHSPNIQSKVGLYKNSFYKTSVYFGGNYQQANCTFCLGVFVGGVTGYDKVKTGATPKGTQNMSAVQLTVLPSITIRANKTHSVTIGYVQARNSKAISFATATYNYSF